MDTGAASPRGQGAQERRGGGDRISPPTDKADSTVVCPHLQIGVSPSHTATELSRTDSPVVCPHSQIGVSLSSLSLSHTATELEVLNWKKKE